MSTPSPNIQKALSELAEIYSDIEFDIRTSVDRHRTIRGNMQLAAIKRVQDLLSQD